MQRLKKWKLATTITIPSFFVWLSFKATPFEQIEWIPHQLMPIVAFAITAPTGVMIANLIFSNYLLRCFLTGRTNIEGFWIIKTEFDEEPTKFHSLYNTGLVKLRYTGTNLRLKAVTSRLHDFHQTVLVHSSVAFISDDPNKMYYLNYFDFTSTGEGTSYGVAFGELCLPIDIPKIQCKILIEGEDETRNQVAVRIEDKVVRKLRKKFGKDNWAIELLKKDGDIDSLLP